MSENTKLWDMLGRTDPKHTKPFKRAGGFSGTAIKPIWSFHRMTEEFGPCGKGWGVGEPVFQVVPGHDGEVLVYCTVSIWWADKVERSEEEAVPPPYNVFGVGGDKVVGKNKFGLFSDDEAFKKAFTDAVTNALKLIGVGADVHMGLFEDNKYVNSMNEEFSEAYVQKKDGTYKNAKGYTDGQMNSAGKRRSIEELTNDMQDVHSRVTLDKLYNIWAPILDQWRDSEEEVEVTWRSVALDLFRAKRAELTSTIEAG